MELGYRGHQEAAPTHSTYKVALLEPSQAGQGSRETHIFCLVDVPMMTVALGREEGATLKAPCGPGSEPDTCAA